MRIIDRLQLYLEQKKITAYAFERSCQVANGYLKKQLKGKGSVGSDILERIHKIYFDLSLIWLVTGEGDMLLPEDNNRQTLKEDKLHYTKEERIRFLSERILLLESSLADKEKIIALLEAELGSRKKKKP